MRGTANCFHCFIHHGVFLGRQSHKHTSVYFPRFEAGMNNNNNNTRHVYRSTIIKDISDYSFYYFAVKFSDQLKAR